MEMLDRAHAKAFIGPQQIADAQNKCVELLLVHGLLPTISCNGFALERRIASAVPVPAKA
jgi:hypothetical protein